MTPSPARLLVFGLSEFRFRSALTGTAETDPSLFSSPSKSSFRFFELTTIYESAQTLCLVVTPGNKCPRSRGRMGFLTNLGSILCSDIVEQMETTKRMRSTGRTIDRIKVGAIQCCKHICFSSVRDASYHPYRSIALFSTVSRIALTAARIAF